MLEELNLVAYRIEQNRIAVTVELIGWATPESDAAANKARMGLVDTRDLEQQINPARFADGRAAL